MNNPYFHEKLFETKKKDLDKINREGWKFVKPINEKGVLPSLISRLKGFVRANKTPSSARESSSGSKFRESALNDPQRNGYIGSLCPQAVRVTSQGNDCRKISGGI